MLHIVNFATTEELKAWLNQYRERWTDIETQDELLRTIQARLENTAQAPLDGMPHASGYTDKIGLLIAQKESVGAEIKRLAEMQEQQRQEINELVARLKSAEQRSVLTLRYLADSKWTDVCEMMFGGLDDYEMKQESYLRRITKAHGKALQNLVSLNNAA